MTGDPCPVPQGPPETWSIDDVSAWLLSIGVREVIVAFRVHRINGRVLLQLRESDLRSPPLALQCLGDIKVIASNIQQLKTISSGRLSSAQSSRHSVGSIRSSRSRRVFDRVIGLSDESDDGDHEADPPRKLPEEDDGACSDQSDTTSIFSFENDDETTPLNEHSRKRFKPEIWKTVVAMMYFFAVTALTSLIMVVVHDRVPSMETYPPLPDIFLDNVPHIPWAFAMCELAGVLLFIIWVGILIFHRHRFILLRRQFSLFGSVFLLRCVTMLITSLSVPGKHLECRARQPGNFWQKIQQAFQIWQGGGMLIQGVRTCGDYMFSGHTTVLTLLNFFITEYSPRSYYYLHTLSWVVNLFGIFFILAAHEHYSIDVFVAFYISTRLFLYYHTLANNRALMQMDSKRTRIWFPLFYFFESGVDGIVPNEFVTPRSMARYLRIKATRLCNRLMNKSSILLEKLDNGAAANEGDNAFEGPTSGMRPFPLPPAPVEPENLGEAHKPSVGHAFCAETSVRNPRRRRR